MAALTTAAPRAAVWLRDEVFDHGVLHMVAQHPHKPSLARVIAAITSLRAACTDGWVPAGGWPPVAAAELGWSGAEAALCAELYADLRIADGAAGGGGGEGDRLPFVPFAMMLFAQGYTRARAAPPSKAEPNASWPSPPAAAGSSPTGAGSPESWGSGGGVGGSPSSPTSPGGGGVGGSPRDAGLARRPTEQAHRLLYVKRALPDVLRAVFGDSGAGGGGAITPRALNELAFLFAGGGTLGGRAPALWGLSPWGSGAGSGVGPTTTSLCEWLIVATAPNEIAYPSVVAHARPFALGAATTTGAGAGAAAGGGGSAPGSLSPQSPGGMRRMMPPTSPLLASPGSGGAGGAGFGAGGALGGTPLAIGPGETPVVRPLVFSGAHKTTIIRTPGHADVHAAAGACERGGGGSCELGDLRIDGCSDAYIYILLPVRHVTVIGCTACVIVVGAVAGGLHVELCENVRVIAAARRLRVSNSMECTFSVHTPTRPIVQGDCRGLALSPHGAQYAGLRAHLREARLPLPADAFEAGATPAHAAPAPGANRWAEPLLVCTAEDGVSDVASVGGGAEGASTHVPYRLVPPDLFEMWVAPVVVAPGEVLDEPLPLPDAYRDALSARREGVRRLRHEIRDASLSEEQRKDLQSAVQALFKEWLVRSGRIREVADLVRLHKENESAASGAYPAGGGDDAAPSPFSKPLSSPPRGAARRDL